MILFTGKGGVGKTSVAAATAVQCARAGYRTVVMSTDPAHSLGDSFDMELGADLTPISNNLWAHEVSSLHEMQRHWAKLHEYAVEVFATQGLDEVVAEEVANPPGMDEIASLMWIKHYAQRNEHDVLIVDCAPTGETLQLLTFPDAAKWWLDKIYPWERRAMRVARPVLQPMMGIPLPSDEVFASLKDLLLDLGGMRKLLTDPSVTSVRIVLNLEKMVVKEAKRAFSYLSLFGYVTDAVIVNRLLPSEVHDELFKKWQAIHKRYEVEVQESFAGIPILNVPLFDQEVVGEKMLLRMAKETYGDRDPAEHFAHTNPQRIDKDGKDYVLALKVPFVDRSAVDLSRHNGELYVTVGNYRREISLPRVLAKRDTAGATIQDGELRVRFTPRPDAPAPEPDSAAHAKARR
ncbi:MAG: arsenite/tail-anchored protein-transporting ATPase [Chloroflexota bacterium]|nr:arsenite/tail-anchored protein-transporting ATPase [Chloroflexota bacterium]